MNFLPVFNTCHKMARITMLQVALMISRERKEAGGNAEQRQNVEHETKQNIVSNVEQRKEVDQQQNTNRKELEQRQEVGQNINQKPIVLIHSQEVIQVDDEKNFEPVKNVEVHKQNIFSSMKKWKESLQKIWQNGEKDNYTSPKKAFGKHLVLNALETIWHPGQEISVEHILAALVRSGNGRLLVDDEIQFTPSRIYMMEFTEFDSEDVCEVLYEILVKRVDLGLTDKDYQNIDMLCKHITWSPDQMLDKRPVYFTTYEKKLVCTDIRKFRELPTHIEFMRRVNEYITDGNIFHKVARLS